MDNEEIEIDSKKILLENGVTVIGSKEIGINCKQIEANRAEIGIDWREIRTESR